MQLISAGFDIHKHLSTHARPIFGRQVIGYHTKFTHRINARFHRLRFKSKWSPRCHRRIIHTVNRHLHLINMLAGSGETALVLRSSATTGIGPRRQRSKVQIIPPIQRQLHDPLVVDHLANGCGF